MYSYKNTFFDYAKKDITSNGNCSIQLFKDSNLLLTIKDNVYSFLLDFFKLFNEGSPAIDLDFGTDFIKIIYFNSVLRYTNRNLIDITPEQLDNLFITLLEFRDSALNTKNKMLSEFNG